ncbi:MAG: alpha-amylase family glycosyl hydrolase [Candidatus Izemoplasmataceae bacterium]
MLKRLLVLTSAVTLMLSLAACGESEEENDRPEENLEAQEPTVEDGYLADDTRDGMILHAWNWSMETIEAHLEDIAIAGFSTIQISPMQPQKDYSANGTWGGHWWKLYQPLGFDIATEDHAIGTLSDLESLTEAADEYGIKVIVDVVANHLGGGSNESFHEDVEQYEPEIYEQNLIHTDNGFVNDNSIEAVTRGAMGEFPDLMTEHDVVQGRVLDLLKAYVDAGVDGFRFDAAKHIETPEDGEYASDFWPTVIDGVEDHADHELFIYGEILNTAGSGRSYADYIPYMGVTTNKASDAIRSAVRNENPDALESDDYPAGVQASDSVLWPESHDDYAGEHTNGISTSVINKTYAVQASRKDTTSLYFARPNSDTLMGEVGSYAWESEIVAESNRFNNYFIGTDEALSSQDGYFVNERYGDDKEGVMIVNLDGERRFEGLSVPNLPDGEYKDQISENHFTVEDGEMSGVLPRDGVAAIYNNPNEPKPAIHVSDAGLHGSFTDTKTVTVTAYNTTEATYSVNGEDPVEFSGEHPVELSHPDEDATVTLEIEAWYNDYKVSESYTYEKSNTVVEEVTVQNLDTDVIDDKTVAAWVWPQGEDGQWVEGTLEGSTFTFDLPEEHNWFLLATFPEGTESFDWDDAIEQTGDQEVPSDGIFDGSEFGWS